MSRSSSGIGAIFGVCLLIAFLVGLVILPAAFFGTAPFGPARTVTATVIRTYVDHSGSGESAKSHYMVSTDQGIFEVDNSFFLGIWNADELFGQMKDGQRYELRTKGNKVVNFFMQEYPYVTAVRACPTTKPAK